MGEHERPEAEERAARKKQENVENPYELTHKASHKIHCWRMATERQRDAAEASRNLAWPYINMHSHRLRQRCWGDGSKTKLQRTEMQTESSRNDGQNNGNNASGTKQEFPHTQDQKDAAWQTPI